LSADEKFTSTGRGLGHVTHIMKFWDPLYKFGTVKDRNFVFGAHIEYDMY